MRPAKSSRLRAALVATAVTLPLVLLPSAPASAAVTVSWQRVVTGLTRPVQVTSPLDGTGRLFVVEKGGRVRVVEDGEVRQRAYLNIHDRVLHGFDEGLLSIAFHPQWRDHPVIWAAFINRWGNLRINRFEAASFSDNHVDADTGRRVLTVHMPTASPNHYGGQLAFGNDGMLYLSTGDGGGAGDPANSAQDKSSLRGKILRFRAVGARATCGRPYCVPMSNPYAGRTPGNGLVWALGLRNPWRFSVDPRTGHLWIGDVGDHRREEVDRIKAGDGGENLGWSCREGNLVYDASRCRAGTRYHAPRFAYGRAVGHSITGGFVYRGQQYSDLVGGQYIAGDFISGRIMRWADGRRHAAGNLMNVSSFGEGPGREIYAVTFTGGLFQMRARTT
jgi:glucose/arabinose dehydrogenase